METLIFIPFILTLLVYHIWDIDRSQETDEY